MSSGQVLVLGTPVPAVRSLTAALEGQLLPLPPDLDVDEVELEAWRDEIAAGPAADSVVVAVWAEQPEPGPLVDLTTDAWLARAEQPFVAWSLALGAAVARCADGGTIVAVVDRPAPLDCAGWSPESAIADAVEALVRSLARSEGPRGVHVHAVTTPARVPPPRVVAPPPPLDSYPGTVEGDVAGAVQLLLSGEGTSGLTGTVLHADAGRSWR
jgi:NAD(P)-dependent dehydrogenase (short-subunit alcohol dehydrogenase family)